jgi:hypothetical protein
MPFLVCELTSVFFQLLNSRLEGEVRALLAAARKDKESMALAYENTISELRAQVDATLAVNQTTSVDRAIDSSQPNEASATPAPAPAPEAIAGEVSAAEPTVEITTPGEETSTEKELKPEEKTAEGTTPGKEPEVVPAAETAEPAAEPSPEGKSEERATPAEETVSGPGAEAQASTADSQGGGPPPAAAPEQEKAAAPAE